MVAFIGLLVGIAFLGAGGLTTDRCEFGWYGIAAVMAVLIGGCVTGAVAWGKGASTGQSWLAATGMALAVTVFAFIGWAYLFGVHACGE